MSVWEGLLVEDFGVDDVIAPTNWRVLGANVGFGCIGGSRRCGRVIQRENVFICEDILGFVGGEGIGGGREEEQQR